MLILHHYPQSPVAEKVRVVLGMKALTWHGVEIPRVPPKPLLMPLTGGYRRTPVMQIGADVFCDSQCILRELERRFPEPTLFPGGAAGMAWGVSRWTDGPLFTHAIAVVLASELENLPPEFLSDRFGLYFGAGTDPDSLREALPHHLAQLRGQLGWMEERLATGREFMLGGEPGLPDALAWYIVWFLRGRYAQGADLLGEFPHLQAWEARMGDIGHGRALDLSPGEALEHARTSDPEPPLEEAADPRDPQGLAPGLRAGVRPDGPGADPEVTGVIHSVGRDQVSLLREEPDLGRIVVHFPRVGYRVRAL